MIIVALTLGRFLRVGDKELQQECKTKACDCTVSANSSVVTSSSINKAGSEAMSASVRMLRHVSLSLEIRTVSTLNKLFTRTGHHISWWVSLRFVTQWRTPSHTIPKKQTEGLLNFRKCRRFLSLGSKTNSTFKMLIYIALISLSIYFMDKVEDVRVPEISGNNNYSRRQLGNSVFNQIHLHPMFSNKLK